MKQDHTGRQGPAGRSWSAPRDLSVTHPARGRDMVGCLTAALGVLTVHVVAGPSGPQKRQPHDSVNTDPPGATLERGHAPGGPGPWPGGGGRILRRLRQPGCHACRHALPLPAGAPGKHPLCARQLPGTHHVLAGLPAGALLGPDRRSGPLLAHAAGDRLPHADADAFHDRAAHHHSGAVHDRRAVHHSGADYGHADRQLAPAHGSQRPSRMPDGRAVAAPGRKDA